MDESADTPSALGSLAQAARDKQIRQARTILIVVGVLTIIVNALQLTGVEGAVKRELDKEVQKVRARGMLVDPQELKEVQDRAVRLGYLIAGVVIFLGVLFVIFGLIVKRYPVPVTIIGFILYVGAGVIFGIMDPATLMAGIVVKVIFIVALAKAIQAALAYQRDQSLVRAAETPL
jgi:hypothetical protein